MTGSACAVETSPVDVAAGAVSSANTGINNIAKATMTHHFISVYPWIPQPSTTLTKSRGKVKVGDTGTQAREDARPP